MSQSTSSPPPPDPLHDLIARVTADVKVAYQKDVIAALVELERLEPGDFVVLYNQLKACPGFLAGQLNKLMDAERSATSSVIADPDDTATILVKLAQSASLFFVAEGTRHVFADIEIKGRLMTLPITSEGFHDWLVNLYFRETRRAPNRDAFKNALDTIKANVFDSDTVLPVYVRIGHHEGKIYLDRGTDEFDAIEIDADGWRVIPQSPIKFIRPSAKAGVLPIPEKGGRIDDLRKFVNLSADRDFYLFVAYILSCYLEDGEFPFGLWLGPHGSAKTTAMKRACALIDPILKDPPGPARVNQDVMVNAQTSHVQPMDNVKHIGVERSAIYCRMLTGGQERSRTLYTNADAFILDAHKPIAMSSTIMVVTEKDLADRLLMLRMGRAFEDANVNARKSLRDP